MKLQTIECFKYSLATSVQQIFYTSVYNEDPSPPLSAQDN